MPKRDPNLAKRTAEITRDYLAAANLTQEAFIHELNELLPPDCQYNRAIASLWASGKRIPPRMELEFLAKTTPITNPRLFDGWVNPVREAQISNHTTHKEKQ